MNTHNRLVTAFIVDDEHVIKGKLTVQPYTGDNWIGPLCGAEFDGGWRCILPADHPGPHNAGDDLD